MPVTVIADSRNPLGPAHNTHSTCNICAVPSFDTSVQHGISQILASGLYVLPLRTKSFTLIISIVTTPLEAGN